MTDEQVEDAIDAAADLISVLDDLRPLDPTTFNACQQIWQAIAAIPPGERHRLLLELEPGSLSSLWKASMSRYVLPGQEALSMFEGHSVWDDLPRGPGEVYTFEGMAERSASAGGGAALMVDAGMQARYPRQQPWLKPRLKEAGVSQTPFTQHVFMHRATGLYYSRIVIDRFGPLARWLQPPCYNRIDIDLVLTPLSSDAGADITMVYPAGPALDIGLQPGDLPSPLWPKPRPGADAPSPFSQGSRDYVRPAGPGVYVGCGYRTGEQEDPLTDDECVYFALVLRDW